MRPAPGRRRAALAALVLGLLAAPAVAAERAVDVAGSSSIPALAASLWPAAEKAGVPRALFDRTFAGLTPDPAVAALTHRQPEFTKPIGAYLAAQVTPARIATGRALLGRWATDLGAIEGRFGVPPAVVVAIWGLETGYGASTGNKDVIRSLATLAAIGDRPDLYRTELVAALTMLAQGAAERPALRGSWAGAMGQPQFMPSSFLAYAVDADGDGRRDIWTSVPDALASIANFIRAKGWQPGEPWGLEVRLPQGYDPALSRGSLAEWTARGVTRAGGTALPTAGGPLTLLFPTGAAGPAFLVTPNFEVLKTYNMSDAYVLSIGELADRMGGGPAIRAAWPDGIGMGKPARIALQARLAALGLPVDDRQGRVSLALRDTVRLAQAKVGLVPDGEPTDELLRRLQALPATPR